jgi:ABC-type nitrate/sulfonate/bicarbonate transport system permease component
VSRFNWPGWLAFAAVLVAWEIASRAAPGLQLYLPSIGRIFASLAHLVASGAVLNHLGVSLLRFIEGYAIAAALAVSLGVFLGYFPRLYELLEMSIEFLRPMPSVAIIPVAILALGLGDAMIVAVTVYACVWPILINTIDGVRSVERTLVDTGRTFGLGAGQILWRIILPAASPYIVTGLRIGLAIALILVTTAEMVAGSKGVGFFILDEERSMNSGNMYAGVLLVALLGYALNRGFLALERKAMHWQHGMIARWS